MLHLPPGDSVDVVVAAHADAESDGEPVHTPDDDYDDLSATIRLNHGDPRMGGKSPKVRVFAEGDLAKIAREETFSSGWERGFPFTVSAGEIVVVKVISRDRPPILIAIVEKKSGRVPCSYHSLEHRSGNVGICAIENNTLESQQFILAGAWKNANAGSNESWSTTNHSVEFQKDAFQRIEFEVSDDRGVPGEVKVDLLRVGAE